MNEQCITCKKVCYALHCTSRCPSAECAARLEASVALKDEQIRNVYAEHGFPPYIDDLPFVAP